MRAAMFDLDPACRSNAPRAGAPGTEPPLPTGSDEFAFVGTGVIAVGDFDAVEGSGVVVLVEIAVDGEGLLSEGVISEVPDVSGDGFEGVCTAVGSSEGSKEEFDTLDGLKHVV